MESVIVRSQI